MSATAQRAVVPLRDIDLQALAAVELAVATWDAGSYPNPRRGAAPYEYVLKAMQGRAVWHLENYSSDRAKLLAALRRLIAAGLVDKDKDGCGSWYSVTAAGDQRLADEEVELPGPHCHACDAPDGRTDLNEAASASSGTAGGSLRYPLCVTCLLDGARESLAYNRGQLERALGDVEALERKVQLLEQERNRTAASGGPS